MSRNQNSHRISGYRIDEIGIHDRFLPWRHFGFWKYARACRLKVSDRFITLVFTFEGRKKPLKIDFSNSLKNARKAAALLKLGLQFAPSLLLDTSSRKFLEEILDYEELASSHEAEDSTESKLARAELNLGLGHFSEARKIVKNLLETGGQTEERSRLVRMQSYMQEGEETLAEVEFKLLTQRFPDSERPRTLWAIWKLARESESAETYAKETLNSLKSIENRLDLEPSLINFLVRKRRYDEAIERIDQLLADESIRTSEEANWLNQSKEEIEKLVSDKKYNRQQTIWRPLRYRIVGYFLLGLVFIAFCWPAIRATPQLLEELSDLNELSRRGTLAQSGNFHPDTRDIGFGFVTLSFVFNLQGETPKYESLPNFPSHYGSITLRNTAAKAILSDTQSHSVVYLPESPFTCTIYPVTKENYIGLLAEHAPAYLFAVTILLLCLYYQLKGLYRKLKYKRLLD